MMTIAFATFISVANATAEDLGAAPEQQPTGEVVILVPAEPVEQAPAVVEEVPVVEEAPVVEPAPVEEAKPEPVVEPVVEEQVKVETVEAPEERVAAVVQPAGSAACPPGSKDDPVTKDTNKDNVIDANDCEAAPGGGNVNPGPAALKCQGGGICRVSGGDGAWVIAASDSVRVCHATNGEASLDNGFNLITPNSDSIFMPGGNASKHGNHPKDNFWTTSYSVSDIVEPFSYFTGDANSNGAVDDDEVADFAGLNLGANALPANVAWSTIYGSAPTTGAAIIANGCVAPTQVVVATCPNGTSDFDNDPTNGLDCRPPKPVVTVVEVDVCHAAVVGGFDVYQPATWTIANGDVAAGHGADVNDVIPSFNYVTGHTWNGTDWVAQTATFTGSDPGPGQNLGDFTRNLTFPVVGTITVTLNGTAMLANGCATRTIPQKPPVVNQQVRLCHSDFGILFTPQLVDVSSVIGPGGHSLHNKDVIPAFGYTTGYTYNAATNAWVAQTANFAGRNLPNRQGLEWNGLFQPLGITGNVRLLRSDCMTPSIPPKPIVPIKLVTVCHADSVFGFSVYVPGIGTASGIDAGSGHGSSAGLEQYDVVPSFTYVKDYVWTGLVWQPVNDSYAGKNLGTFTRSMTQWVPGQGIKTVTRTLNGTSMLNTGCSIPSVPDRPDITQVKVQVCHANQGNGGGFYSVITVDHNAITPTGHGTNQGTHGPDIIPAFTYTTGHTYDSLTNSWVPTTATYGGKNLTTFQRTVHYPHTGNVTWTIDGAAVGAKLAAKTATDADCSPADPPAEPPVADKIVSVCHATTDLNGFDTFVPASWTIVNGNVNAGHGLDSADIIPSFAYIVDHSYDVASNSWLPVYAKPDYPGQNLGSFTKTMNLPVVGSVQWSLNGASMLASQNCAFTQPAPKPPVTATPVTLCHATTLAGFDTYVKFVGTSDDVIGAGTHGADANDIIPAFTYTTGYTFDAVTNSWSPVTQSHGGQNLGTFTRTMNLPVIGSVTRTLDGTQMLANDCQVPSLPVRPDIQPVTVSMCHAYVLDGRDYYSLVSTGHTAVLGATGHDLDANDVIPAFTYTTGYTYDHVTNSWIAQTASYAGKNLGTFTRTVNLATGPATLTFDGTAMLVAGTCPTPTVPTSGDAPAPTPDPDVPGGGDEPDAVDADPVDTDVAAEAEEPASELAATEDEDALPFTGLELGALLLIGFGAVGAGAVLHGGRRRRRVTAKD